RRPRRARLGNPRRGRPRTFALGRIAPRNRARRVRNVDTAVARDTAALARSFAGPGGPGAGDRGGNDANGRRRGGDPIGGSETSSHWVLSGQSLTFTVIFMRG